LLPIANRWCSTSRIEHLGWLTSTVYPHFPGRLTFSIDDLPKRRSPPAVD
jgi:hypothetical protein